MDQSTGVLKSSDLPPPQLSPTFAQRKLNASNTHNIERLPVMKCKVKSYKPRVFQHLRQMAQVDEEEYMESMCAQPLEQMINPGASGAKLYTSGDQKYIIKTVQSGEAQLLKDILDDYTQHLERYPHSLLPRFLGYYTFKLPGIGKKRLVVMKNLFSGAGDAVLERFDLKGSRHKRTASAEERAKHTPTLKDLNFLENYPHGICLGDDYDWLMLIIRSDCKALDDWNVMDYSLLMGITTISEQEQKTSDLRTFTGTAVGRDGEVRSVKLDLGIIDILQEFTIAKSVESAAKGIILGPKNISVIEPKKYRKRFEAFLSEFVFHPGPSSDAV